MLEFVLFVVAAFIGYRMGRAHEKALQQVKKDLEDMDV